MQYPVGDDNCDHYRYECRKEKRENEEDKGSKPVQIEWN
jgi:hypothetical protein